MSLLVDIEKRLDTFTLRVQFEAEHGATALLGASGCGKSVTLKCIAGIMTPDRGRIVLDGETLFDSERRVNLPPQRRCVGYLFQQYALFPNMTVQQNILCGIRTGSRAEKQRAAAEQLRRFRLDGLEKRYPSQLSGGQAQRVALARILASQPRAILLDEPFSALDSYLKWNLELELSELLADFGGPILWVSHDLGECCRNCRRVCVMEQGRSGEMTDMAALVRRPTTLGTGQARGLPQLLPCARGRGRRPRRGLGTHAPAHRGAEARDACYPGRCDQDRHGRSRLHRASQHPRPRLQHRSAPAGRRSGGQPPCSPPCRRG